MVRIKSYLEEDTFRSLRRPKVVKEETIHLPSDGGSSSADGLAVRSSTLPRRPQTLSRASGSLESPTRTDSDITLDFDVSSPRLLDSAGSGAYKECFACKIPIHDDWEETWAMGKQWHRDCFACSQCAKPLSAEKFCEKEGKAYCEPCHNALFLPKCYSCSKTVFEIPVRALSRNYHPRCFTCRKCSQELCPFTFHEKKGSFYCEEDFHNIFSPKCLACGDPIRDQKDMTKAMGATFHRDHFVCCECAQPLPGNNYLKRNGNVYCEKDYHNVYSPRCSSCDEPIIHDGILALGKKWHRDCCLRCGTCNKILREDNYIAEGDKAYCRSDWVKQFAPKCHDCGKGISQILTGEAVIALDREYHPHCFVCQDCNLLLDERTYYEVQGEPYCQEHYHNRTCVDCLKARAERQKTLKKVVKSGAERSKSAMSARSITPINLAFRSKSSQM